MGYYMDQVDSKFSISLENESKALAALKAFLKDCKEKGRNLGWVNIDVALKKKAFAPMMGECRWDVEEDGEGKINGIQFNGEKLSGDEISVFKAIAPFVDEGSYIEMNGEEGARWRWIFQDGDCIEKHPEIIW